MIFGSQIDFNLLIKINRELLSDVIEQEIVDEVYDNSIKGEDLIDSDYEYGDDSEPEIEPEIEQNDYE